MTESTTQIPGYTPGTYKLDPGHSDVAFTVRHMMVSKVRGHFTKVEAGVRLPFFAQCDAQLGKVRANRGRRAVGRLARPDGVDQCVRGHDPSGLKEKEPQQGALPRVVGRYSSRSVPWVAIVGLLESLLTAKLVDDITDTHSDKTRETWGQGAANVITGFFGGMGGCAMIGQTMINVKEGRARTRISTFLAGLFLLLLCVTVGDVVGAIPMAALVAVMLVIAVTTLDWHSIAPRTLRLMPRSETVVMLVTVGATLVTDNLAIGVVSGVLTAMVAFARRVAHMTRVETVDEGEGTRTYRVSGELFWASSNDLVYRFDYAGDPEHVVIDLTDAEVWDASTVATFDSVQHKYAEKGKRVEIVGLDGVSMERLERLSGNLD